MDPGSWANYGEHYPHLGGGSGITHPPGLTQPAPHSQLSAFPSAIQRPEAIGSYHGGNQAPLMLPHQNLNIPSNAHSDSFGTHSGNLLVTGCYDVMLSSTLQPSPPKSHLAAPLNVSSGVNLFKSTNESELNDLRGGFSRSSNVPSTSPGMIMHHASPPYAHGGLFSPQAMSPPTHSPHASWQQHANFMSATRPFGILPHEAVLPREPQPHHGHVDYSPYNDRYSHVPSSGSSSSISHEKEHASLNDSLGLSKATGHFEYPSSTHGSGMYSSHHSSSSRRSEETYKQNSSSTQQRTPRQEKYNASKLASHSSKLYSSSSVSDSSTRPTVSPNSSSYSSSSNFHSNLGANKHLSSHTQQNTENQNYYSSQAQPFVNQNISPHSSGIYPTSQTPNSSSQVQYSNQPNSPLTVAYNQSSSPSLVAPSISSRNNTFATEQSSLNSKMHTPENFISRPNPSPVQNYTEGYPYNLQTETNQNVYQDYNLPRQQSGQLDSHTSVITHSSYQSSGQREQSSSGAKSSLSPSMSHSENLSIMNSPASCLNPAQDTLSKMHIPSSSSISAEICNASKLLADKSLSEMPLHDSLQIEMYENSDLPLINQDQSGSEVEQFYKPVEPFYEQIPVTNPVIDSNYMIENRSSKPKKKRGRPKKNPEDYLPNAPVIPFDSQVVSDISDPLNMNLCASIAESLSCAGLGMPVEPPKNKADPKEEESGIEWMLRISRQSEKPSDGKNVEVANKKISNTNIVVVPKLEITKGKKSKVSKPSGRGRKGKSVIKLEEESGIDASNDDSDDDKALVTRKHVKKHFADVTNKKKCAQPTPLSDSSDDEIIIHDRIKTIIPDNIQLKEAQIKIERLELRMISPNTSESKPAEIVTPKRKAPKFNDDFDFLAHLPEIENSDGSSQANTSSGNTNPAFLNSFMNFIDDDKIPENTGSKSNQDVKPKTSTPYIPPVKRKPVEKKSSVLPNSKNKTASAKSNRSFFDEFGLLEEVVGVKSADVSVNIVEEKTLDNLKASKIVNNVKDSVINSNKSTVSKTTSTSIKTSKVPEKGTVDEDMNLTDSKGKKGAAKESKDAAEESPSKRPMRQCKAKAIEVNKKRARAVRRKAKYSESSSEEEISEKATTSSEERDENTHDSDSDPDWSSSSRGQGAKPSSDSDEEFKTGRRAKAAANNSRSRSKAGTKRSNENGTSSNSKKSKNEGESSNSASASAPAQAQAAAPVPVAVAVAHPSNVVMPSVIIDNERVVQSNFQSGDFVILTADLAKDDPPIWRIQGKSLLQKYESFEENDKKYYRNLSIYSGWTASNKGNYQGIAIRFIKNNRSNCVVEYVRDNVPKEKKIEITSEIIGDENGPLKESFEVFIQTLVSQSLDVAFIEEINKENDEYFLKGVKDIDSGTNEKKDIIEKTINFTPDLKSLVDSYSEMLDCTLSDSASASVCKVCKNAPATKTLALSGNHYDNTTLQVKAEQPDPAKTEVLTCKECTEKLTTYHKAQHLKFYFYRKCYDKVSELRAQANGKESDKILEECLRDLTWMTDLYKQMVAVWESCGK